MDGEEECSFLDSLKLDILLHLPPPHALPPPPPWPPFPPSTPGPEAPGPLPLPGKAPYAPGGGGGGGQGVGGQLQAWGRGRTMRLAVGNLLRGQALGPMTGLCRTTFRP